MRWPLAAAFCAPTSGADSPPTSTKHAARSPARKECLFIGLLLLVPGVLFHITRVGVRVIHGNTAIGVGTAARLFGFGGHLRQVQYQFLLTSVACQADTRVGGGAKGV